MYLWHRLIPMTERLMMILLWLINLYMRDGEHPMFNYYNQISAYLLSLWAHFFHAQYTF